MDKISHKLFAVKLLQAYTALISMLFILITILIYVNGFNLNMVLVLSISVSLLVLSLILTYFKQLNIAKFIVVIIPPYTLLIISILEKYFNVVANTYTFLIPRIAVILFLMPPVMFFGVKQYSKLIISLILLSPVVLFFDYFHHLFGIYLEELPYNQKFYHILLIILSFFYSLVLASVLLFQKSNILFQKKINNQNLKIFKEKEKTEKQNKKLKNLNEEFLVLNEELNQKNDELEAISEEFKQNNEELLVTQERIVESEKKYKQLYEKSEDAFESVNSSIRYAKTIQDSLLVKEETINKCFNDYFLLFKPKEKISGDFYYVKKYKEYILFSVADCTGHGIPGGFITMLGITFLHEIVSNKNVNNPGLALNLLRNKIKNTFKTFGSENPNGMDLALCALNTKTNVLSYSGAYNPLWIIRNNELHEYKATRNPIGFNYVETDFKNYEIQLQNNDLIYIFSDGFQDQISEATNKKFLSKNFKKLLLNNQLISMKEQKEVLEKTFNDWKGNYEQVDDVTVMGVKWKTSNE